MFLQGWVNGILINESSVYGTLCIVLLKILNMGLYFSEIDTRGWPYRRRDLLLPFNHSFANIFFLELSNYRYITLKGPFMTSSRDVIITSLRQSFDTCTILHHQGSLVQ